MTIMNQLNSVLHLSLLNVSISRLYYLQYIFSHNDKVYVPVEIISSFSSINLHVRVS